MERNLPLRKYIEEYGPDRLMGDTLVTEGIAQKFLEDVFDTALNREDYLKRANFWKDTVVGFGWQEMVRSHFRNKYK